MEIDSLRRQLHAADAGKKGKARPQINMDGRTLTLPELREEYRVSAAAKRAKEEAEQAKQQVKANQRNAQETERVHGVTSRVFTTPLGQITKKEDLKDVAACFGLSQEGTNVELMTRIKGYMLVNPSLMENSRFAALFRKRGSKNFRGNEESQPQNDGEMDREMKMEEIMDRTEIAGLEGDSFWKNIDPALRPF
jgi:hypothetical protein